MSEWPRMRHSCVQVSEASARAFWRLTSIAGRMEKHKTLSEVGRLGKARGIKVHKAIPVPQRWPRFGKKIPPGVQLK